MSKSEVPVGIDLGTTFSAVAYLDDEGRPTTITNSEGDLTTPTVVFFDRDGVIIGAEANFAGETEPERLAKLAKREMGNSKFAKQILNRHLPPEVIQSLVLNRLKQDAELRVGRFEKAVVTVPAYFNEPRRKATQDAGKLAGLDVIDIINEPTAAAMAYGVQQGFLSESGQAAKKEMVLVYDLGGGTFDVTLMELDQTNFNTVATAGDVYLGGVDWDQRIFDFAAERIADQHGIDCRMDQILSERLSQQCTRAKKTLTARGETAIRLEHEGKRFKIELTRNQFEEITRDLLERTRLTTDRLLRDSNFSWDKLTKLILVGGSTRMPMVQNMLEQVSGLAVDRSLSPDESIAHGAAIYAGILLKHGGSAGKGISVKNVNSHDLGVLGVDPKTKEPKRQIVIKRNHRLPAKQTRKFVTARDNQKKIVVKVVEGGTATGEGATHIGKCIVDELPKDIKKGTPVVVTFQYLNSGRLKILATIPDLDITAASSIDRAHGMSDVEIAKWRKEIEKGLEFSNDVASDVPELKPEPAANAKVIKKGKAEPKSKPRKPVADKKPAGKKPVERQTSAAKNPVPVTQNKTGDANVAKKPTTPAKPEPIVARKKDSPLRDDPNRFNFNDEKPKSAIGKSALNFLDDKPNTGSESVIQAIDEPKKTAGESVLDFLNENIEDKKASQSDSALGDFLSDLET